MPATLISPNFRAFIALGRKSLGCDRLKSGDPPPAEPSCSSRQEQVKEQEASRLLIGIPPPVLPAVTGGYQAVAA
jgi:hypothetical protein